MKTAEEMYQYCVDNQVGVGSNQKWTMKHFTVIQNSLADDEEVLMCFVGLHNFRSITKHDNNYAYAITNKRIIMAQKKVVGQTMQTVSHKNLNDITFKSGAIYCTIVFDTMKEQFNVGVAAKPFGENINNIVHDLLIDLQSQNNATVVEEKSVADELVELKKLVDMGILTEDEFNAKKKQLLGI